MDMDDELELDEGQGFDLDQNSYYFDASDGSSSRALGIHIKTPQGKDLTLFVSVVGVMIDYSEGWDTILFGEGLRQGPTGPRGPPGYSSKTGASAYWAHRMYWTNRCSWKFC